MAGEIARNIKRLNGLDTVFERETLEKLEQHSCEYGSVNELAAIEKCLEKRK